MQSQSQIDQDLAEVRRIVLSRMRGRARVFLYGSRARGTATKTSDIDVGIVPNQPLPPDLLSEVREALEESTILYPVEVVDLSRADARFRDNALKDATEWSD